MYERTIDNRECKYEANSVDYKTAHADMGGGVQHEAGADGFSIIPNI
jgi:hypothetical protein